MRRTERGSQRTRPPYLMIAAALVALPVAANASRIQQTADPLRTTARVVAAEPAVPDSTTGVRPGETPATRGL